MLQKQQQEDENEVSKMEEKMESMRLKKETKTVPDKECNRDEKNEGNSSKDSEGE